MQESTTREKILKKIRSALISKTPDPYPNLDFDSSVYHMTDEVPDLMFARAFREAGGNFKYCADMLGFAEELLNLAQAHRWKNLLCVEPPLSEFLKQCEFPVVTDTSGVAESMVTITRCECLIARTGSIVVSSAQAAGRSLPLYTPFHIVVAFPTQLVDDIKDALNMISAKYKDQTPSNITFITGPANHNQPEMSPTSVVAGPKEVHLFLVNKPEW